jgi:hypothetical protein
MAVDFPNSPVLNQTVVVGNKTYRWTGVSWDQDSSLGQAGPTGPTGPLGPTGPTGPIPTINASAPIVWNAGTQTLSGPTIETVSGSQSKADAAAAAAVAAHNAQQTNVHGIFDVEELETQLGALEKAQNEAAASTEAHRIDTTDVHGIPNTADIVLRTMVDAKGDLIAGTADNLVARLGVGANGTTLEADSTQATGIKWSTTVGDHIAASTSVHGISNTSNLVYYSGSVVRDSANAAISPYHIGAPSLTAIQGHFHLSPNAIDTAPRTVNTTTSLATGTAFFTFFTPLYTLTVSNITYVSGTIISSGVSIARFGLYTVDASDNATLVARTDNDTGILSVANTAYTKPFSILSGYPASYTLTAGQRYAVAIIMVATGAGSVYMNYASPITTINSLPPRMAGAAGSQADLPTSRTSYSNTVSTPWARLS